MKAFLLIMWSFVFMVLSIAIIMQNNLKYKFRNIPVNLINVVHQAY